MAKTYTQEEVNEINMNKMMADFLKEVHDFKDDIWNAGFAEGYSKGFEAAKEHNQQNIV